MPRRPRILLAITSHGLGHLTRTLAIAGALRELHPRIELIVATTLPRSRVARHLPLPFESRVVDYEPGVLQADCFRLDCEATRLAYGRFLAERAERLEAEERFLRESRCDAVIADIPALPVRAAAALGIPAIGIANFTWDWILEPLLGNSTLQDVPRILADDYAQGTLHLRLPFGPPSSPFPRSEEVPLVSRPAQRAPREVRERLGLPAQDDRPLVLVCPGGWNPEGWGEIHVRGCEGLRFLTVGDLPVSADVPVLGLAHDLPFGLTFPDLVAAADVVLTKPGYGTVSECAVHRTPVVAIERPAFRETPLLVDAFRRIGPLAELSLEDFFSGRWEAALRSALGSQRTWAPLVADGTRRVAGRVAELLALEEGGTGRDRDARGGRFPPKPGL